MICYVTEMNFCEKATIGGFMTLGTCCRVIAILAVVGITFGLVRKMERLIFG
jgi:hypothetical protein